MKKNKLWTKDYTRMTCATVLSCIGGEVMNLPISLLVFDQTRSTMAAAVIMICGLLPDILFPILIAPLIDRGNKKPWIVGMDALLCIVYTGTGILVQNFSFQFVMYVIFTLAVGTISVFYRLAYNAWFPDLIPLGAEQQGYTVSSAVYPTVTIVMAPVATFLYDRIEMHSIFYIVAVITFFSILIECGISEKTGKKQEKEYSLFQYFSDIKNGFRFVKSEKGIRNIYTYMSITSGAGEGTNLLIQAYFQSNPALAATMLGVLKSAEMVGRMMGSFVWYKKQVPAKKRYPFTKFSYTFYELMDLIVLFLPFPGMLVNRFLCGGIGCGSATIRETAVQSYLPPEIRARVNAFFDVIMAAGGIGFQMIAGYMGNVMSYRTAVVLIALFSLVCMLFLIVIPGKENRKVYEASR